jgi:hypothetical protein
VAASDLFSLRQVVGLVVEAAHRGILRRGVDSEWLLRFIEELERRCETSPLDEVAADFIRIIAECPEAQDRLTSLPQRGADALVAPALVARPAPLHCIPLGCIPAAAGVLRRAGLRRWPGPFDGMTIPPAAVRDSLADDFAALLHAAQYEAMAEDARPAGAAGHLCRHSGFSARYGETLFHHHDPSTAEGYAALERSVLSLRQALRGLHGKMLFQLAEETPDTLAIFAETAALLDRMARGAALAMVVLLPGPPEGPFPEMELAESFGPHRLLRCRTLSEAEEAGAYPDPLDEVVMMRGALACVTRPDLGAAALA